MVHFLPPFHAGETEKSPELAGTTVIHPQSKGLNLRGNKKMEMIKATLTAGMIIFFLVTLNAAPLQARPELNRPGGRISYCTTRDGTCCAIQPAVLDRNQKADYQQKLALLEEKIKHAMDDLDAAEVSHNVRIWKSLQQKVEMLEKEYWQLKMAE